MKRDAFLKALESVECGLDGKNVLEQSACVVFQDRRAYTYNEQVSCNAPSGLDESFRIAVRAKPLIEMCRRAPDEELNVTTKESALLVRGANKRAVVRAEKEIFLGIDAVERPSEWSKIDPELVEAVGVVHRCAGSNRQEVMSTCVHFTPGWVEACDNYQICRWRVATGVRVNCLVPRENIKNLCGMGAEEVAETPNWLHFRNPLSDIVLSCRKMAADAYADMTPYFAVEGEKVVFPEGLEGALKRADIFSSEGGDDNLVLITLGEEDKALGPCLRVESKGASGGYGENLPVKYAGGVLRFYISPMLLASLASKNREFLVNKDKLKIEGDRHEYIAVLCGAEEDEG